MIDHMLRIMETVWPRLLKNENAVSHFIKLKIILNKLYWEVMVHILSPLKMIKVLTFKS